jgi:hypothetical protein
MAVRTLIDSGKHCLISSLALILNRQATNTLLKPHANIFSHLAPQKGKNPPNTSSLRRCNCWPLGRSHLLQ